ncbi:MAG: host-nuclease inhibitor Gam family protein [Alphaproteobacteria bacterium]|nr:host-nuclease inhibitor Gam family protein [Alphaproteobacteria bacterium]MDD9919757.1 host-nuclease inhibitor Gam family protein [Alphaproteobacteria bacterium]
MPKRKKTEALNVAVPKDDQQVVNFIHRMGNVQNQIARIKADASDEILAIKEREKAKLLPLEQQETDLVEGIQAYCEVNRDRLCGKNKSHDFGTGTVAWRFTTKTKISKKVNVLELLEKADLKQFIRTKHEIDREAIRENPEAVRDLPGITITKTETFAVEPRESIKGDN